jgi:AcrR family transcriptional regulator
MTEDSTRTRILNVAGAAFAERGFQATTVRDICRVAEVNLAAVNYHFGDKERLYIEAIKHSHRFRVEQAPLPQWPPGTPPERRLRDFVQTTIARMLVVQGLPWQERLMMREMLQPMGACRELVEDYFRPHLEQLLEILDEMVPPDWPAPARHQLAFSIVGQCLFYRFHDEVIRMLVSEEEFGGNFSPGQLADHITDVTLAALGRRPLFPNYDRAQPANRMPGVGTTRAVLGKR